MISVPAPCAPARGLLALLLGLAVLGGGLAPPPAAAQGPGIQLVVEEPAAASAVQQLVEISGWAVDPASPTDSGISPDAVEVWLGPAGTGQRLGQAGYGDPRPDVADRFGSDRFRLSGFRYFWNSCDAPPGPNLLTITARGTASPSRIATATVPVTIESCQLAVGDTVTGQMITSGQADPWTFEGTAGQRVSITLDGYEYGGWDPFLELIAPDGTREDQDDDSGPDLDSWLSRRLGQSATYTVRAHPFSNAGCTRAYTLPSCLGPAERSDPNRAAGPLGTTTQFAYRGSLREFGERQPWTFEGAAGQELIVYLPRNVGSSLAPHLALLGPDGRVLAEDEQSGGGVNAFIQGILPADGTYTLEARSARDDCGGDYVLRVEPDWGDQSQLRGNLAFDAPVTGSLSRDVRRDVWSFPTTAGERVTLLAETNGPTRLQVAAPSGDWEQEQASPGRPLALSFEPAESGTYAAVVFVDTSQPIDYQLTLQRGYGALVSTKGPVPLGQPVSGEIHYPRGRDLYTFTGQAGQQVRIALDQATARSPLDPYLELQDPTGRTIAEDDDSGGGPNGVNALIQVPLPVTGQYTIVARGFEDTAGPYVLNVTLSPPTPSGPATTPTPAAPAPATTPTPAPPGPTPGPSPAPPHTPVSPPPGPRR